MNSLPTSTTITLKHDLYGADIYGLAVNLHRGDTGHVVKNGRHENSLIVEFTDGHKLVAVELEPAQMQWTQTIATRKLTLPHFVVD